MAHPDSRLKGTLRFKNQSGQRLQSLEAFDGAGATNNLIAKAKVTEEDLVLTKILQERQQRGEFVLRNERPASRKIQEYRIAEIAAQTASKNADEYGRIFSNVGVDPVMGEKLQAHLEKIHKASLEAEIAIGQVLDARREYDHRVHSLLGEENYLRYREYEDLKRAREEFQDMQRFLGETRNLLFTQSDAETIIRAINESKVAEARSWHGPYDPLPDPRVGQEEVIRQLQQQSRLTSENAKKFINSLSALEMPAEHIACLTDYFAKKVEQKQSQIEFFSQPPPVRRRNLGP